VAAALRFFSDIIRRDEEREECSSKLNQYGVLQDPQKRAACFRKIIFWLRHTNTGDRNCSNLKAAKVDRWRKELNEQRFVTLLLRSKTYSEQGKSHEASCKAVHFHSASEVHFHPDCHPVHGDLGHRVRDHSYCCKSAGELSSNLPKAPQ